VTPAELRDHLIHEHGRSPEVVDRVPAGDLHRLEHVEHALGLLVLDHHHDRQPEPAGTSTPGARAQLH
jgi:hypothetical protein